MKINHLLVATVLFTGFLIPACSKSTVFDSKPGVIGLDPDYQPEHSGYHDSRTINEQTTDELAEVQEALIGDLRIDVGFGSPLMINVNISGTWPEPCSQLAEIKQTFDGKNFAIRLLATFDDPLCPSDYTNLPFTVDIPLNMADKQTGIYTVRVNSKETSFDWIGSMSK